ncbi:MAG: N-formylglutamate amidohydrolase [Pirellulaceae bacterium]
MCILISCEAGGKYVPAQLLSSTSMSNIATAGKETTTQQNSSARLNKYRTDKAALYAAHRMSKRLGAPLIQYQFALDAIDVTRSLRHPKLFSKASRSLSSLDRQRLIDEFYVPYREAIKNTVAQLLQRYTYVLHLSVRSFDLIGPKKKRRRADVGLLYDPSSSDEVDLCADWLYELYYEAEMLKVRRNYPRRGTADSLTKAMRAEFSGQSYLGIELLLNRAWAGRPIQVRDEAIDHLCDTLRTTMQLPQTAAA